MTQKIKNEVASITDLTKEEKLAVLKRFSLSYRETVLSYQLQIKHIRENVLTQKLGKLDVARMKQAIDAKQDGIQEATEMLKLINEELKALE